MMNTPLFFFLFQINLYRNLLSKKHGELIGNMERLEGGLEKLKSTAAQVWVQQIVDKIVFELIILVKVKLKCSMWCTCKRT